jgi:HSP20 family protein
MTFPFNELDKIYRQIEQTLDDSYNAPGQIPVRPLVELAETTDSLLLRAMLPGIDRAKLNIEVTREAVLISGTYLDKPETEKSQFFRSEFPRGAEFRRVVSLPFAVANTAVKANYEEGILTLTLPKAPELINKVVKVSVLDARQPGAEIIPGNSELSEATESDRSDSPWDS